MYTNSYPELFFYCRTGRGDIKGIYGDVTAPIMEALVAYDSAEFDRAVDIMRPLRYNVQRVGGSHAQVVQLWHCFFYKIS